MKDDKDVQHTKKSAKPAEEHPVHEQPKAEPAPAVVPAAPAEPAQVAPAPAPAPHPAEPVHPVAPAEHGGQPNPFQPEPKPTAVPPVPPVPPVGTPVPTPHPAPRGEFSGVKGWLAFFMVLFGLAGIGALAVFVAGMSDILSGDGDYSAIVGSVAYLVMGVVALFAATRIALRKRTGQTAALAAVVTMAVVSVVAGIVQTVDLGQQCTSKSYESYWSDSDCLDCGYSYKRSCTGADAGDYTAVWGMVIINLVCYGLLGMYFRHSRRVKETLVEP